MSNNKTKITSIVEIKTLEKEVQLMMVQYEHLHLQSMNAIHAGQKPSQHTLQLLKDTNDNIISLLAKIKNKIDILYPKGITNQHLVTSNNKNLIDTSDKLHAKQSELNRLMGEHSSLDGENIDLTLQLTSTYYEYVFYLIIMIIIGIYVFKIYSSDSGNDIVDIIILIAAIVLLLFHFMGYFVNYVTNSIQFMYRKIMSVINLL